MKSKYDIEISEIVKRKRIELNISQRTLGEIIGTDHSFITRVENPSSVCRYSATQLILISKYFGCPVADLFPDIDPLAP